ncbi:MAG TPA: helix-turn-helix transcriptional regulator [Labilithrix sp.]|nr:helix-turn-helix transcriptional regulator [Labilithrix sp.]
MPPVADPLSILEAAYRVEQPEDPWLRGVLDAARPSLDRGRGVIGYFVDVSTAGDFRAWGLRAVGRDEDAERVQFERWSELTPIALKRHTHLFWPSGFGSQIPPLAVPRKAFDASLVATGFPEVFGISALDATGRGCALAVPYPDGVAGTAPDPTSLWDRVAAHLSTAARLRVRLESASPPPVEAVLDPGGKVQHAEGDAKQRSTRDALRDAAVRIDRARSRSARDDAMKATELWPALVAKRWSLVDQFDRDGRRYLVARPNEPALPASSQLTAREAQVVAAAALGHSNKMIAYELSVSGSTVAACLSRAARKLGVSSRVELIRLVAQRAQRAK